MFFLVNKRIITHLVLLRSIPSEFTCEVDDLVNSDVCMINNRNAEDVGEYILMGRDDPLIRKVVSMKKNALEKKMGHQNIQDHNHLPVSHHVHTNDGITVKQQQNISIWI